MEETKCLMCNNDCEFSQNMRNEHAFYDCHMCGRFIVPLYKKLLVDKDYTDYPYDFEKTATYMFYNKSEKPFYLGRVEGFNSYKKNNPDSQAKYLSAEDIENWYPKTISEKIDKAILKIKELSKYDGDTVVVDFKKAKYLFFVHLKDCSEEIDEDIVAQQQIDYIVEALMEMQYIYVEDWTKFKNAFFSEVKTMHIVISPKGLAKVYDLQKSHVTNNRVFVAMKYGDETDALRAKIKEGIRLAGYEPRIMDEIEHNKLIVPEMLYEIEHSKFMIAELSNHSNGVYYESGYAYGLHKEVIHLCSNKELEKGLHFDVAQLNTITYDEIDEIPEKIRKRIQATIK